MCLLSSVCMYSAESSSTRSIQGKDETGVSIVLAASVYNPGLVSIDILSSLDQVSVFIAVWTTDGSSTWEYFTVLSCAEVAMASRTRFTFCLSLSALWSERPSPLQESTALQPPPPPPSLRWAPGSGSAAEASRTVPTVAKPSARHTISRCTSEFTQVGRLLCLC